MKTFILLLVMAVPSSWVLGADTSSLAEHLQRGLFEEEANHNLEAAISEYTKVIRESEPQRRLMATALIRLAECYRKQGKDEEAQKISERMARDFSEFQQNPGRQPLGEGAAVKTASGEATSRNSLVELGRVLDNSPDLLNAAATNGLTFLQFATAQGQIDVMEFLVKRGSRVDRAPTGSPPPLFIAVQNGNKRATGFLIDAGADVNSKDAGGSAPLHYAAEKGYAELSALLLAKGADINVPNSERRTPLHFAASAGQAEEIAFLVKRGANIDSLSINGWTPLMEAVRNNQPRSVAALVDAGADLGGGKNKLSLLIAVTQARSLEVLAVLLEKGADPNVQNGAGATPLMESIGQNLLNLAKVLLEKGANPDLQDVGGSTALHRSVHVMEIQGTTLLLDHGANPNLQDKFGRTPLHYVVGGPAGDPERGTQAGRRIPSVEKVRLLLDYKADPNIRDKDGMTPFQYAVEGYPVEIVEMLLKAGADVTVKDANGNPVSALAHTQQMRKLLADYLTSHPSAPEVPKEKP